MNEVIVLMVGFAIGSIPFGFLIARIKNINLRHFGSGNVGATNVGRALGPKYFLLVFMLDALKGIAAVMIGKFLNLNPFLAGLGAILGHIFTPFLKFRGGKGVATSIGVLASIFPRIFLIGLVVWIIVYLTTFYVSLASLCFATAFAFFNFLWGEKNPVNQIAVLIVVLLIFSTHLPNIRRLIKKSEPKTIIWRKE
ncbi:MAG: glycerol-3-phosphate 1-O-acyltransferase PlsY [candidate division WOR-3 bacterium]